MAKKATTTKRGGVKPAGSAMRQVIAPVAAVAVIALFGGSAIFGQNGLVAFGGYSRDLDARRAHLAELEVARTKLEHRVALLDPKKANPDLVDELARKELGVAHPDELIIPLD